MIAAIAKRYGTESSFAALIAADRAYGSIVYDAAKDIPVLHALAAWFDGFATATALNADRPLALAARSIGIRIDIPGEDAFVSPWHQEYPHQPQTPKGYVFWTPIYPMTAASGPVEILTGSHHEGVLEQSGEGFYDSRLAGEAELVTRYSVASPLLQPGDVLLLDFLTVHRSGRNTSASPRWSAQWRYYDLETSLGNP